MARRVAAIEALPQAVRIQNVQILGRVGNRQGEAARPGLGRLGLGRAQLDSGRGAPVAQAVREQVLHDAAHGLAVGLNYHTLRQQYRRLPPALGEGGVQRRQHIRHHIGHADRLLCKRAGAVVSFGILEERIHESPHRTQALGSGRHAFVALGITIGHGVQLKKALGARERRAHIVGERGQIRLQRAPLLGGLAPGIVGLVDKAVRRLRQLPRRRCGKR